MNYEKCSIFFGETCPVTNQEHVRDVLIITSLEEKYLGLPTPEGRMSKVNFRTCKQALPKDLSSGEMDVWHSLVERCFIKSVAQALPTYIMGVFKLPFSVCDDLTRMVRNFYWGSETGKRKVHWKGWDHLMQPKERGGIGF